MPCAAVGIGSSLSSHLAFHPSASLLHVWLGVSRVTVGSLFNKDARSIKKWVWHCYWLGFVVCSIGGLPMELE